MLTPFEIFGLVKEGVSAVSAGRQFWRRKKRVLDPEEKIALRARWKSSFEEQIHVREVRGLSKDVIIRDVKRVDTYPEIPETKGISPWFRVGLVGTYERGVMVGLRWTNILEDNKKWHESKLPYNSEEHERVLLTGFIPYENIEHADWDGDRYYGFPHIYCHFVFKGEPYEKLTYCRCYDFDGREHFSELVNYQDVLGKS